MKSHISILILSTVLFIGCSESFLDVESITEPTTDNFYRTIDDAERALIGCYDGWQRTSANGNLAFYVASEVMSDQTFGATGNSDGRGYQAIDRFDISQSPSDANLFNGTWTDYYAAIFRCNSLLVKMEQIEWNDDNETRGRIEGETRVLRAMLYFDLVRLFGYVPLVTEPSSENFPQSEPIETYRLIAQDLKFAADNIPTSAYPKSNAAKNDGRISAYAAKALLARVYLFYTGYENGIYDPQVVTKAEVLQGLEDVINSNEFELVEEFKNLWPAASAIPAARPRRLHRV